MFGKGGGVRPWLSEREDTNMRAVVLAGLSLAFGPGFASMAQAADAPAAAAPATKPAPSDKAQIAALEKRLGAAISAKDVNKVMSFYVRKGLHVFDVTVPREFVGADAYRKDWEELFKMYPGKLNFTEQDLVIETDGNLAYSRSIQTLESPGAVLPKMTVRVTDIYRKIDGRWLIAHEHVSAPVDFETGKADLLSKP